MRKTCDSSNAAAIESLSARALWMSCPKGFSKTTRVQNPLRLLAPHGGDEARAAEPLDDRAELVRGDGEIKEAAANASPLRVGFLEEGAQPLEGARIAGRAPEVADAALEVGPEHLVHGLASGEGRDGFLELCPERDVALFPARHPDHERAGGERSRAREVVERRHQLAAGEVPRSPEDHDRARVAAAFFDKSPAERVFSG